MRIIFMKLLNEKLLFCLKRKINLFNQMNVKYFDLSNY